MSGRQSCVASFTPQQGRGEMCNLPTISLKVSSYLIYVYALILCKVSSQNFVTLLVKSPKDSGVTFVEGERSSEDKHS